MTQQERHQLTNPATNDVSEEASAKRTKTKQKKKYLLDDEKARARTGTEEPRKWVRRKGPLGNDVTNSINPSPEKTRVWRKGTSNHLIK